MRRAVAVLVTAVVMLAPAVDAGATSPRAARRVTRFELRPVLTTVPSTASAPTTTAPVDVPAARATVAGCDVQAVGAMAVVPTSRPTAPANACVVFPARPGGARAPRYYLGPAGATAAAVRRARAEFQSGQGWTIRLDLTKAGAAQWDALARRQFHQQVAIVLDGLVQSAPEIQPDEQVFSSFAGRAVISGNFGQHEARALAAAVNRARHAGGG